VAYNNPSGVTVHRVLPDGTVGSEVTQPASLDGGVYAHQVRVDPSNKSVILVTRGNGPASGKAEDPGALKIFDYKDGVLSNKVSIAPGGGLDFQSRHMDFDPAGTWVYVTLERQNKLHVYERRADGTLGSEPVFVKSTLAAPQDVRPRQIAGSIHVHPGGRFVYVANRADATTASEGRNVFAGGENSIAVYQIHETSGEPRLIQTIDTRGIRPHTFAIDLIGRILVAANSKSLPVLDGGRVVTVPASLAVFRIRDDGCLEFVQRYDVELSDKGMVNWMGIASLPE
jgi:6-phosphogluconolactonase